MRCDSLHLIPTGFLQTVRIDVHRRAQTPMAENALQRFIAHSLLDAPGCEAMAQRVETESAVDEMLIHHPADDP